MQAIQSLDNLKCILHPEEKVQMTSMDAKQDQLLYCVPCLLFLDKNIQQGLVNFKTFSQQVAKELQEYKHIKVMTNPPVSFTKIIEEESQLISDLETRIVNEKQKINQEFQNLQDSILKKLETAKMKALETLDQQLINLHQLLKEFKERFQNTFIPLDQQDAQQGTSISSQDILNQITSASTEQTEQKIREILKEIEGFRKENLPFEQRQNIEIEKFSRECQNINQTREYLICSFFSTEHGFKQAKSQFRKAFKIFLNKLSQIQNPILLVPFGTANPSSILSHGQLNKLKSLVLSDKRVDLILQYKGITNSFSFEKFKSIWQQNTHFLLIIKTDDQIIGSFRTNPLLGLSGNYINFDLLNDEISDVTQELQTCCKFEVFQTQQGQRMHFSSSLMLLVQDGMIKAADFDPESQVSLGLQLNHSVVDLELFEVFYELPKEDSLKEQIMELGKSKNINIL